MLPKALHLDSASKIAGIFGGLLTLNHVLASFIEKLAWHIQQLLHEYNFKSTKICMCGRVENNETMCIWSKMDVLAFPLALRHNCTSFHIKFEPNHQQKLAQAVPQRKHSRHLHRKQGGSENPTARGALHKKYISFTDWREVRLRSSLKPWFSLSHQANTHSHSPAESKKLLSRG